MQDASFTTCSRERARRSPRQHYAGSARSTTSKLRSADSPPSAASQRDKSERCHSSLTSRHGLSSSAVAKRSLRGIAVNFLFLGSEAGGERAAILCTVLETAKLNGLDPEAYLADVIDRMANGHPINRLAELLPWSWSRHADKLAA
jgi:hypothetical protein